ncbi:MAG: diguanylate cyclase, partial [Kosmotogaceae bacterium]|nr:diguanylate cyclase [Kosmotogaceae bacterium]
MKNWLKSISLAALATLFWATIGFVVTEVRYSEVESQIANSARLIAENTAKTTFIGHFHRHSLYEAVMQNDNDFTNHYLMEMLASNVHIKGVAVFYNDEVFASAGEKFEIAITPTVEGGDYSEIFSVGKDLFAISAFANNADSESSKNVYVIMELDLEGIMRLLTREGYKLGNEKGSPVLAGIFVSLERRWLPANYAAIAFVFLLTFVFAATMQRMTGKKFLVRRNREMSLLLDKIPTLIWYFRDPETFGIVNKSFAEFLGMRPEEIEGKNVYEILTEEEAKKCVESNREVFSRKEKVAFEQNSENSIGEIRILEITKTPDIDEFGNMESVVCSANDVTEERRALRRIKLIQFGLDNANDEAFWIAPDGTILYANSAACKNLGYTKDEISGLKVNDLDKSMEAMDRRVSWERLKSKGRDTFEAYHVRKDGSVFPVEINRNYFRYDESEYEFTFARDISERMRSLEILERDRFRIERLHDAALNLERCGTLQDVYDSVIEAAKEILEFDICFICVNEEDNLVIKASSNLNPRDPLIMPNDVGIVGKTFREKKPYIINDIQESPNALKTNSLYHAGLSLPVGDVGVFQAMSSERSKFGEQELHLAELLMSHAREAIVRIETEIRMNYMSLHDKLTDLYNRVYFEEELKRLEGSRFYPISIVSADVDGLKLINDTMGHSMGDQILVEFSQILRSSFRKTDVVSRFGGDEFAVILIRTDEETTEKIASRVRRTVERYNADHVGPHLSVSMGIATSKGPEQDLLETLKLADDLMYRDKLYRSSSVRSQMVNTLLITLDEKDQISGGHAKRLQKLCLELGKRAGLNTRQLSDLALFAQVHDLGKVGIPDSILFKPGPLSEDEWKVMKLHPEKGYRIAVSSPDLSSVADLILRHHERWDGRGYPLGISGEDIPVECRILSIVDAFDAM